MDRFTDYCAGILGIDPDPFTLKQLAARTNAREKADWDHTAFIAATIHNSQCAEDRYRIKDPSVLNPLRSKATSGHKITLKELDRLMTGNG